MLRTYDISGTVSKSVEFGAWQLSRMTHPLFHRAKRSYWVGSPSQLLNNIATSCKVGAKPRSAIIKPVRRSLRTMSLFGL